MYILHVTLIVQQEPPSGPYKRLHWIEEISVSPKSAVRQEFLLAAAAASAKRRATLHPRVTPSSLRGLLAGAAVISSV